MNLIADIEDQSAKFVILKSLLSEVVSNNELNEVLQEQIDKLAEQEAEGEDTTDGSSETDFDAFGDNGSGDDFNFDFGGSDADLSGDTEATDTTTDTDLPSPSDLGAGDFTDANLEI